MISETVRIQALRMKCTKLWELLYCNWIVRVVLEYEWRMELQSGMRISYRKGEWGVYGLYGWLLGNVIVTRLDSFKYIMG